MAFTHYLLTGLKKFPALNFKLSPPLHETLKINKKTYASFQNKTYNIDSQTGDSAGKFVLCLN